MKIQLPPPFSGSCRAYAAISKQNPAFHIPHRVPASSKPQPNNSFISSTTINMIKHLFTLISFLSLIGISAAQTPVLVKDINPGSADGLQNGKDSLVAVGNVVFFAADDGISGKELWRSDGTEAGTYLVKDIQPGSVGSGPTRIISFGDKILFFANDGIHGDELWVSDGTEAGTMLVKDINPGAEHAIRRSSSKFRDQIVMNGMLFFSADYGTSFGQLWRSDGTEQGTEFVSNVCPTCIANIKRAGQFTVLNDILYFVGIKNLWRSDGTTAGTYIVVEETDANWPVEISDLSAVNGKLYFAGGSDASYLDLWESDGTKQGTKQLVELSGQPGSPTKFTFFDGHLYFFYGSKLWRTDGTQAGTVQASDLQVDGPLRYSTLYPWKGELYFRAILPGSQGYIYKTAGGINNEEQVFEQNLQFASFNQPIYYASTDEYLFYDGVIASPAAGSIGRVNHTGTVKEMFPIGNQTDFLFVAGNNLFFRARTSAGFELWKLSLGASAATDIQNGLDLKIYPTLSPDGVFQLQYSGAETSDFEVRVFDALGRQVFQGAQAPNTPLRLSNLPAGNYVVRVSAANGQSAIQKVVINP